MTDSEKELENVRNQQTRMTCIDYATRVVGKPVYLPNKEGEQVKYHDEVVEVAKQIYEFVSG